MISTEPPTHKRGVNVLGSILRNSHEDYMNARTLAPRLLEQVNSWTSGIVR
jgi:hypothetical protein